MTIPAPVLRYPGAKWLLASWIIDHIPAHQTYVEPFFGSGAVFFNKPPSASEYLNDLDGEVVHLFRTLREQPEALAQLIELTPWAREEYNESYDLTTDPLERARRTLVRHWQAYGGTAHRGTYRSGWRHTGPQGGATKNVTRQWDGVPDRIRATAARLRGAQIDCLPAVTLLGRINGPDVLAYVDPPYLGKTRKWKKFYAEEMFDEASHTELLETLLSFQGLVLLSGYASELYDDLLVDWARVERRTTAEKGQGRVEVLWINPRAAAALELEQARQQVSLFEGGDL
ncbi:DNA adenine methylase [Deinococcus sp. HMF7620]|uniref:DNA adenine methylase n=1 Tax=Deinococcus arboris TaxID=2682977 RepID=A0A7C9LNS6_9DEIO|nr:DNA adenine methylase [Deinococcus arboris]MVN88317.1 DNA adenine methylase [Deinococcus arboris]